MFLTPNLPASQTNVGCQNKNMKPAFPLHQCALCPFWESYHATDIFQFGFPLVRAAFLSFKIHTACFQNESRTKHSRLRLEFAFGRHMLFNKLENNRKCHWPAKPTRLYS